MRVELRIELATRVVVIDREYQVPCAARLVGALDPHARRRRALQFLQGRLDRLLMRLHQPVILAECRHNRDRLGGRQGEFVQMAPPGSGSRRPPTGGRRSAAGEDPPLPFALSRFVVF
jgi:hypothetical protein